MTNHNVELLVLGGGIGGLATALAMAKLGYDVHVLEQAPEFKEIGAGLQLAPNGLRVLDELGVLEAVKSHAVFPGKLVLMDAMSGKKLSELDLGEEFVKRYGYEYIVVHRSDLLDELLKACQANDKITLLNNKQVNEVNESGGSVEVKCADGSSYTAEIIIGADGIRSKARELIVEDELVCSEFVAYRGTIPMAQISEEIGTNDVVCWTGPDLHLVQYPVRRKELFNQVVVFKSYNYDPHSDNWGTTEELERRFSQCCDTVKKAVGYIEKHRRWPLYDREPIDNWTKGNLALLGDSAHPMLQYLAQGACQALEDVSVLSETLKGSKGVIQEAFQIYQEKRIPRASKVQTTARVFGDILHTEDATKILLRNAYLEKEDNNHFDTVDWLYKHME